MSKSGSVYLMRDEAGLIKIGRSSAPSSRLTGVRSERRCTIELVYSVHVMDCWVCEEYLHAIFKDRRISGEWFRLSDEDIESIMKIKPDRLWHEALCYFAQIRISKIARARPLGKRVHERFKEEAYKYMDEEFCLF